MREATPDDIALLTRIFGIGVPIFILLLWVTLTSAIVGLSGWGRLQRRFPNRGDAARLRLSGQNGYLGASSFKGALWLEACPLGLRVGKSRLIGPFHGPFEVPWEEISAEPTTPFHGSRVLLRLGKPEAGTLAILESAWVQLSARRGA